MAGRLAKLLRGVAREGTAVLTGGLSMDSGLVAALIEVLSERDIPVSVVTHENGVHAGAIGAALWGAHRHDRLAERVPPLLAEEGR
jgi:benzoyl-CoA reductase subunit D